MMLRPDSSDGVARPARGVAGAASHARRLRPRAIAICNKCTVREERVFATLLPCDVHARRCRQGRIKYRSSRRIEVKSSFRSSPPPRWAWCRKRCAGSRVDRGRHRYPGRARVSRHAPPPPVYYAPPPPPSITHRRRPTTRRRPPWSSAAMVATTVARTGVTVTAAGAITAGVADSCRAAARKRRNVPQGALRRFFGPTARPR